MNDTYALAIIENDTFTLQSMQFRSQDCHSDYYSFICVQMTDETFPMGYA